MDISIAQQGARLHVTVPENDRFAERARALGGIWQKPIWSVWLFDADKVGDSELRTLCQSVYGTDGVTPQETVSVEIEWIADTHSERMGFVCCGRSLAVISGLNAGAELGAGVKLLTGGFGSGGGSWDWRTTVLAGTKVRLHEVSRQALEAEIQGRGDPSVSTANRVYTILEPSPLAVPHTRRHALADEQARLADRLREIEAEIAREDAALTELDVAPAPATPSRYDF